MVIFIKYLIVMEFYMEFSRQIPQIFLDCDGVLANWNGHADEILGMVAADYRNLYGEDQMWDILIKADPYFWLNLKTMPDSFELYDAVSHLNPIVLTGIPRQLTVEQNNQKLEWIKLFQPTPPMIMCRVSQKAKFCQPGDVLVDDRNISKKKWEKADGIFIFHNSAKESIQKLKEVGVL